MFFGEALRRRAHHVGTARATQNAIAAHGRALAQPTKQASSALSNGYIPVSAGHSPLNAWPLVSVASARNVAAPFGA